MKSMLLMENITKKFVQGIVIGLIITLFAGYIPAKKAANVDPVDILRK